MLRVLRVWCLFSKFLLFITPNTRLLCFLVHNFFIWYNQILFSIRFSFLFFFFWPIFSITFVVTGLLKKSSNVFPCVSKEATKLGLSAKPISFPHKSLLIQKTQNNTPGLTLEWRSVAKSDMLFAPWNVRTLYRECALKKLTQFSLEYKLNILAVQEVHWTGKGVMGKRNCSVYYSCRDRTHHFGMGFIVSKRIPDKVLGFISVNEKICRLCIKGRIHNYLCLWSRGG